MAGHRFPWNKSTKFGAQILASRESLFVAASFLNETGSYKGERELRFRFSGGRCEQRFLWNEKRVAKISEAAATRSIGGRTVPQEKPEPQIE